MTERHLPLPGERLSLAMKMAGRPESFADVGADHGLLSAYLLLANDHSHAIITDLSSSALSKARRLVASLGLDDRAEFYVGDGLAPLKGKAAETVFILGMGGDTVSEILQRGKAFLRGAALIVSGQTEMPLLRKTVYEIGYFIAEEKIAREKDRWYFILRCEAGERSLPDDAKLFMGQEPDEESLPHWLSYWEKQEKRLTDIAGRMRAAAQEQDEERLRQTELQLNWIHSALAQKGDEKG